MDVELEEVEERVVDEVDRAVDFFLDAEKELEGPPGFVARREGDVGELAGGVGDVFACVAVQPQMSEWILGLAWILLLTSSDSNKRQVWVARLCSLLAPAVLALLWRRRVRCRRRGAGETAAQDDQASWAMLRRYVQQETTEKHAFKVRAGHVPEVW